MNNKIILSTIFISLCLLQGINTIQHPLIASYFVDNYDIALLAIQKLGITPSRSLCKQLGRIQCESGCCIAPNEGYQVLRQFQTDQENGANQQNRKKYTGHLNEQQLCNLSGRSFCGGTCCLNGRCTQSQKNETHLTYEEQLCTKQQPTDQQLCESAGLLWCFNQCCGFSSTRHKCYRRNLYGVPYIRCPIQPKNQEQL